MNLTKKQREVLSLHSVNGVCVRYVWHWTANGEPVSRQVAALLSKGFMNASYYKGGTATANISDMGRIALEIQSGDKP